MNHHQQPPLLMKICLHEVFTDNILHLKFEFTLCLVTSLAHSAYSLPEVKGRGHQMYRTNFSGMNIVGHIWDNVFTLKQHKKL